MNYSDQISTDMTTEMLDAGLARIQTFPCTADVKKTALERCVYMSLVYQLKFADWLLSIVVKLDQKISACIKRIIGLSRTICPSCYTCQVSTAPLGSGPNS